jgi:hypothetical protein
VKCSSFQEE